MSLRSLNQRVQALPLALQPQLAAAEALLVAEGPEALAQGGNLAINPVASQRSSLYSTLAKVVRLALRYFGGHQFSIPGVLLRIVTLQVLIHWFRHGSLKRALFGVPLSKTTYVGERPNDNQLELLKAGTRFSSLPAAVHGQSGEWIREARGHGFEPLNPRTMGIPLAGGESATDTCIYDVKTGLKTMLFRETSTNRLVIAFGALRSLDAAPVESAGDLDRDDAARVHLANSSSSVWSQYHAVGTNFLGIRPELHMQAADLVGRIKTHLPEERLHCVGQCLAGSIATFCALKHGATATTFNPLALGAGLQADLSQAQLERAVDCIQAYSAHTDMVSNPHRVIWGAGKVVNLLGIRTPIVLGNQLVIPTAYTKRHETHDYITGSLTAYLSRFLPAQPDGATFDNDTARRMKPSEILNRFNILAPAAEADEFQGPNEVGSVAEVDPVVA